jgi:hypothetical protein
MYGLRSRYQHFSSAIIMNLLRNIAGLTEMLDHNQETKSIRLLLELKCHQIWQRRTM